MRPKTADNPTGNPNSQGRTGEKRIANARKNNRKSRKSPAKTTTQNQVGMDSKKKKPKYFQ